MEIILDTSEFDKVYEMLDKIPKAIPKALKISINRTAKFGKTEVSKIIRKAYKLKIDDVTPKISITPASESVFQATLKLSERRYSLYKFIVSASQRVNLARTRKQRTQSPGTLINPLPKIQEVRGKTTEVKNSFFNYIKRSIPLILHRTSKERYPIKTTLGLSAPSMMTYYLRTAPDISKSINVRFRAEVNDAVRAALAGVTFVSRKS